MSDANDKSENIILPIGAAIIGMTLIYAIATDVFGLARPGSRTLYLLCLLTLSVAMVVRFKVLRTSGTRILIGKLPPMKKGDEKKYFGLLLAFAALGSYSVYEIAFQNGSVFIVTCVISTVLIVILAVELARAQAQQDDR